MARSKFIFAALIVLMAGLPGPSRAQTPAPEATQTNPDEVGNIASVEGAATVTRNGRSLELKVQDPVLKGDVLRTGADATLGVIFDDETTFNLSANSSILIDNFVYQKGGKKNAALFSVAIGVVAFAAHEVAKTGDMKIATPTSTLGIRGTTGVVEVPAGAAPGSVGEVSVKLYPDANGRVGRIELFGLGGGGPRLGLLTQASTGFAVRPGAAGRFAAVPLRIPPQQIARDRAFVQRTFAARGAGRPMIMQRQNLRTPGLRQQTPGLRQQTPGLRQQTPGLRQQTPSLRQPGSPRPSAAPPGTRPPDQQTPGLRQPSPRQPAAAPPGTPQRQQATPGVRQQAPRTAPDLRTPNAPRTPGLQRSPNAPRTPNVRERRAPRDGAIPPVNVPR